MQIQGGNHKREVNKLLKSIEANMNRIKRIINKKGVRKKW